MRLSHTPEYRAWRSMHRRFYVKTHQDYKYYGGRGITVDTAWDVFEQFLADMGYRPSAEHTVERKDNNLGYSKSNCRWATREDQSRNMRSTKLTMALANTIRQEYASGKFTHKQLAAKYGLGEAIIGHVMLKRRWA